MNRLIVLGAGLLVMAACSSQTSTDNSVAAKRAVEKPAQARQKTIFDDQLKALDKARGVQKTVDDAAKATDQAIKDSGG
jgi:hypothetical protein